MLVSGWKFLPHSYSVVAQFVSLELLRRAPALKAYFEDRPYFSADWRPAADMFDAAAQAALGALPPPAGGVPLDAELRYDYPCDLLRPARAVRTLAFCTAEFLCLPPAHIAGGLGAREAQARHDFTILTCSRWAREGFVRSGVPPERIAVVPLGFDPALFRPAAEAGRLQARAQFRVQPDEFVFLNVGAMSANKGLGFLLRAFAEVVRARPQARLVLKGTDALYPSRSFVDGQLEALDPASARAVGGRVRYLGGELSFGRMAQAYQSADCYVSPYIAEGFNLPVLEAAACGLPVICTAGGPTDDFVTDDFALRIRSELVPVADPFLPQEAMGLRPDVEHLTQLMLQAIDDRARREAARAAGPAYVTPRYTWQKVVDALLALALGARA